MKSHMWSVLFSLLFTVAGMLLYLTVLTDGKFG